jgi:hypothetical protein
VEMRTKTQALHLNFIVCNHANFGERREKGIDVDAASVYFATIVDKMLVYYRGWDEGNMFLLFGREMRLAKGSNVHLV